MSSQTDSPVNVGPLAFGPDRSVWTWTVENRTEAWTRAMKMVTTLGDTVTLTIVAVLATAAFCVLRQPRLAVLVGAGSLIGYGLMVGLKHLIGRDRPPSGDRLLQIETFSMPSGHAMMSTVVYGLMAVAGYQGTRWVRTHRWVLAAAPILAVAIGWSRVYLGVHWMTDVIAGWVIGVLYVAAASWLLLSTSRPARHDSHAGSPSAAESPQNNRKPLPRGRPDKS
jgi:undecaprenyl-diphosphatase